MADPHLNQATIVRFTPEERALIEDLRAHTGLNMTSVLRLALRAFHRSQLSKRAPKKAARRG
jgi:hypothetical protein